MFACDRKRGNLRRGSQHQAVNMAITTTRVPLAGSPQRGPAELLLLIVVIMI
jgi:hypothetical protein